EQRPGHDAEPEGRDRGQRVRGAQRPRHQEDGVRGVEDGRRVEPSAGLRGLALPDLVAGDAPGPLHWCHVVSRASRRSPAPIARVASRYATARCFALSTGSGLLLALLNSSAPSSCARMACAATWASNPACNEPSLTTLTRNAASSAVQACRCSATFCRIVSSRSEVSCARLPKKQPPEQWLWRMRPPASSKMRCTAPTGSQDWRATR